MDEVMQKLDDLPVILIEVQGEYPAVDCATMHCYREARRRLGRAYYLTATSAVYEAPYPRFTLRMPWVY